MEGCALPVMLPLWSYKSELLTTISEAYQHLHFNEGADILLIWLLRARSYKTRAEA